MRPALLIAAILIGSATTAHAGPPINFDDAALRAVKFVDKNEGWAVGDQGAIWHTIDSGKTWERQPTGSRASLRAVQFLTPYTGFAAGRVELPNGAGSAGVVLATVDGGGTWRELSTSLMPGLNAVQFFDENRGIVVGDGSDVFPSGAFRTDDGGKSWVPLKGPRALTWLGLDCTSFDSGLIYGQDRVVVLWNGSIVEPAGLPTLPPDCRVAARIGDRAIAIGCGAGGPELIDLQLQRNPAGNAKTPDQSAARTQAASISSVNFVGEHVWTVGRPGTLIWHSLDSGKTWEAQKTDSFLPFHALHMLDDKIGWAVGELGTIIGTTDGGKTWTTLKTGGQRAAVLFTHARSEAVPLGATALLGGEDGYLATVVAPGISSRLSAVMRSIGGAAGETGGIEAWPDYMAERPTNGGPELLTLPRDQALLGRLVLAIRTWRPEIIVTDRLATDAPLCDQVMLLHTKEAFVLAADPKAFPEQIEKLGLAIHAAKKLYAIAPPGEKTSVTLDLTGFQPALGEAVKDSLESVAGALGTGANIPDRERFQLIAHRLPGAEKHTTLMQGIELAPGGTARRKKTIRPETDAISTADLAKNAALRRQLEAMLANTEAVGGRDKALAQIAGAIVAMPDAVAARTGVALGFRLVRDGQWTSARELFALVAERYPAEPASIEAVRWLLRYHASGEVRRRIELGQQPIFQQAAFAPAVVPAAGGPTTPQNGIQTAAYIEPLAAPPAYRFSSADAFRQWNQACVDLEPKLAAFGAGYALDPANNLCLVAARRHLGLTGHITRQLGGIIPTGDLAGGWPARLADELRLDTGHLPQTTPLVDCSSTPKKPFLDGKLDDECWKTATPLTVKSADHSAAAKGYTTTTRFVRDDQFLYVAVECGHPEGKQVPKAEQRARDADLVGHDRVELLLDLDRDYQTYYRLRVDHRGCVAEDCWGDIAWNPKWFVAVDSTKTGWTAELAIPLAELTGDGAPAGHVWAMNVVRVVPSVGVDSWGGPSGAAPRPTSMGLLRFAAAK
ncbi:YCF48-related protein [Fimbriiglobus ruber]|uniref:Glycosyl hydrolase, BNR repeat n=1 Tax=Fimbriiglobus ruber TaxID=1908690 RepID=A0A225CZB4_9BACT|nr:YCF48-related protein [Fimbriiglobus ruber]OWK34710.1 Glycosyl hydrolase, BNR repeat [Fimbriiglobus ruber]